MRFEVCPGYSLITPKQTYQPGETLELDEKEGKRLIDAGIVKVATGEAGGSGNTLPPLNAPETVKLILAALALDALDAFKDDTRKTVQDALVKRRGQLNEEITIGAIGNVHNPVDLDSYLTIDDGKPETRPAVLEAIDKRRLELTPPE